MKVCLVLSGGGATGFSFAGILSVLVPKFEQNGIEIDMIVSNSQGSMMGGLLCASLEAEFVKEFALSFEPMKFANLSLKGIMTFQGLSTYKKLTKNIDLITNNAKIENLKIKFRPVAMNKKTKQIYVFDKGNLANAISASCSVPGLVVPQKIDGQKYVDCLNVSNFPCEIARELSDKYIIGINGHCFTQKNKLNKKLRIMHDQSQKHCDYFIDVGCPYVKNIDFTKRKIRQTVLYGIEVGKSVADDLIASIKAYESGN